MSPTVFFSGTMIGVASAQLQRQGRERQRCCLLARTSPQLSLGASANLTKQPKTREAAVAGETKKKKAGAKQRLFPASKVALAPSWENWLPPPPSFLPPQILAAF